MEVLTVVCCGLVLLPPQHYAVNENENGIYRAPNDIKALIHMFGKASTLPGHTCSGFGTRLRHFVAFLSDFEQYEPLIL